MGTELKKANFASPSPGLWHESYPFYDSIGWVQPCIFGDSHDKQPHLHCPPQDFQWSTQLLQRCWRVMQLTRKALWCCFERSLQFRRSRGEFCTLWWQSSRYRQPMRQSRVVPASSLGENWWSRSMWEITNGSDVDAIYAFTSKDCNRVVTASSHTLEAMGNCHWCHMRRLWGCDCSIATFATNLLFAS